MIEWDRVMQLREDFGPDSFSEIVDMFLAEVDARFATARNSTEAELKEDYHFIKGSAANLGFQRLQLACAQAESNPEPAGLAPLQVLFEQSKKEFATGLSQRL